MTVLQAASKKVSRNTIPTGCRKRYIAGTSSEILPILKEYEKEYLRDPYSDSTHKLGNTILELISAQRRETWQAMIENINKNSWAVLKKLNG